MRTAAFLTLLLALAVGSLAAQNVDPGATRLSRRRIRWAKR